MLASTLLPLSTAVFRLECSIHRKYTSGILVASEQIIAPTEFDAIADADTWFIRLLAGRSGIATLRVDTGRIVWTKRRTEPVTA